MSKNKESSAIGTALEFTSLIVFFVGYFLLRDKSITFGGTTYDGFIIITAIFVPVLLICTYAIWRITGEISKMQLFTAVLVLIFGGLTVWFNDERFIKIKPTMIYILFAGILGFGLFRGTSYLQMVMNKGIPMTDDNWMKLTRRITVFFLLLAISNEIVWRTMSTDSWVIFKTIILTLATFLFLSSQIFFLINKDELKGENVSKEDSKGE